MTPGADTVDEFASLLGDRWDPLHRTLILPSLRPIGGRQESATRVSVGSGPVFEDERPGRSGLQRILRWPLPPGAPARVFGPRGASIEAVPAARDNYGRPE